VPAVEQEVVEATVEQEVVVPAVELEVAGVVVEMEVEQVPAMDRAQELGRAVAAGLELALVRLQG